MPTTRPGGEGAVAQQAGGDQRVLARAALDRREDGQQREACSHEAEGPQRPAQLAALDQRVDQGQRRGADEAHAERVELDRRARLGLGHEAQRPEQPDHAQRHVDEEDHAPAGAEQIGGDQPAGEDRAGDGGEAHDRAEGGEGAAHLLGREDRLDHAEPLRDEQRAEAALKDAGGDEDVGRRRQRAGDRGQGEPGDADHEHPSAAEDIAQATADDHEHGEGERVARGPPLHGGGAAAELVADGRRGDGDDGAVEQIHDLGDEHDGEHDPAPAVGGRSRVFGREVEVGGGGDGGGGHEADSRGGSKKELNEHCS